MIPGRKPRSASARARSTDNGAPCTPHRCGIMRALEPAAVTPPADGQFRRGRQMLPARKAAGLSIHSCMEETHS
ncbi:MAG: hypothetical protein ABS87_10235 [Sphingomonas sp. SCN 67-18]|nr:MAG: hypothetical protein ABS87_10235 [Sphingomonas sp. SCN 67-18]